ncbi:hypothetical protein O181_020502 [Austropuccinia psidii MF-1]|uniref:Uncharacterized protein n=1 Tax=Austropuccinia psidii MF-1 TaxID=1389203 RepID=A0A9Q3CBS3_9BASI|nr:hypothetical protein [Austropuccinia psidii MF-1]
MSFSLKPKTHINTIHNLWVITPNGPRKQTTLIQELASVPPLIICASSQCLFSGKDMLPPYPPHLSHQPSLHYHSAASYNDHSPAVPSRCPSAHQHHIFTITHAYTSPPLANPLRC